MGMRNKLALLRNGQRAYKKRKEVPKDNIWLFSSTENRHFNYNSKYLFLYVKEHLPEITPYYVMNDRQKRETLSAQYGARYFIDTSTEEGMEKALSARVWFTSAGLPVYAAGLGKDYLIINLWHGIPLKRIALMEQNYSRSGRIYFKQIFSKNYSAVVTSAKELVPVMAQSFQVPEDRVRVWGHPRNDVLFCEEGRKHLREIYPDLPEYRISVLYAPTYRDGNGEEKLSVIEQKMEELAAFFKEQGILFCMRQHILEDAETVRETGYFRLLGEDRLEEVTDVLPDIDVLITDYSSVYLDYLLLDRPILFLPFDEKDYEKERGFNFEYESVTPGKKIHSAGELKQALLEIIKTGTDGYEQKRRQIREKFHETEYPVSEAVCRHVKKML